MSVMVHDYQRKDSMSWPRVFFITFTLVISSFASPVLAEVHIVYLGKHDVDLAPEELTAKHHHMLSRVDSARNAMVYSFFHIFNGFAADLSIEEARRISEIEEVMDVIPSRALKLHTTHSWQLLGLESRQNSYFPEHGSVWQRADYGMDAIIGLIDTGIWPESPSFADRGMGPIPKRWKGSCVVGDHFNSSHCNRKLIGARYFIKSLQAESRAPYNASAAEDFLSPRDAQGHGTHTASTAAGTFVSDVNINGFALGTAKGGAPFGRIAIYKACWKLPRQNGSTDVHLNSTCLEADVLAAMDAAIHDGVDVLSISLGDNVSLPFTDSIFSRGIFHATERGIPVAIAGGNDGPTPGSVKSIEPWAITVAASTTDRGFLAQLTLGDEDNTVLQGESFTPSFLEDKFFPLYYGGDSQTIPSSINDTGLCLAGTLDKDKAKGKIVVCYRGSSARLEKAAEVKRAGGVGMILANTPAFGYDMQLDRFDIPGAQFSALDGHKIASYLKSSGNLVAKLGRVKVVLGLKHAPVVADFSSRGPNPIAPDVLKPDITAPGVNIIAAWPSLPNSSQHHWHQPIFNLKSGTSMATPHVAAVSALLRVLHPQWSPAAIKSAIMTTANTVDTDHHKITDQGLNGTVQRTGPWSYGAGFINPVAASEPGLVYDTSPEEYCNFLCSVGYNTTMVLRFFCREVKSSTELGKSAHFSCPSKPPSQSDLNLPSLAISKLTGKRVIKRTVTNVGNPNSVYKVFIQNPPGVSVLILPTELTFTAKGEKKSFYVTLNPGPSKIRTLTHGSYTWYSGLVKVRSPIVIGSH